MSVSMSLTLSVPVSVCVCVDALHNARLWRRSYSCSAHLEMIAVSPQRKSLCIFSYMHIYIYLYVYTYIYIHVYMYIYIYVCIYVCVHTSTCIYIVINTLGDDRCVAAT